MEKEAAIETILIIPKNQFYLKYQINEGLNHTIKREKAFEYFKDFLSQKNYSLLSDYLSRFLPMLIMVKEDKIIELQKDNSNNQEHYHNKLKQEINSILLYGKPKVKNNEQITNDKKLNKICQKFLK